MLIDFAKTQVFGGKGGNGCRSFYKDIFHRKGIPDGANGGKGGDVRIVCTKHLHTLLDFKYQQHHTAGKGKHGGSSRKVGRTGQDLVLKVPVGTIIRDTATGLVIRDLATDGESVIVAKGGEGGKGNAGRDQATPGAEGEVKILELELKIVADVGLIGFPNAGKSTMISKISKAHPKTAPYPFTTKSPKLGVVDVHDDTIIVADMPGLIGGAHSGRGLGDRFLKHIERTSVLIHVVDLVPPDGADPADNFFKLEEELRLYGNGVSSKPRIIGANKMDMPGAPESLERFKKALKGEKVFPVSAIDGTGLEDLVEEVYNKVEEKRDGEENNS